MEEKRIREKENFLHKIWSFEVGQSLRFLIAGYEKTVGGFVRFLLIQSYWRYVVRFQLDRFGGKSADSNEEISRYECKTLDFFFLFHATSYPSLNECVKIPESVGVTTVLFEDGGFRCISANIIRFSSFSFSDLRFAYCSVSSFMLWRTIQYWVFTSSYFLSFEKNMLKRSKRVLTKGRVVRRAYKDIAR